ncbi:MAG: DUF3137 domain-containing protein [Lachnospiraceae bacterium]|nr:DUF3137 domain-containing protein [Lachnospiraceae bacterium]
MNEEYMRSGASNEAITKLQEKRNKTGKGIIFIAIGALFLVIPPIGLAIILYGTHRIQKLRQEMKELYKEAFVREPLMNNFENVTYEPQWGFPAETVESFQLCQMGNQLYSEDYIRASYAGVDFEIAEVRVYDVYSTDDRDEHSTTYFEGRMMVFHLPDKAVYPMSIFSRKYKHRAISRREAKQTKVEFESSRFNKAFDVYAQNEHDAFYLITPQFMERLEILADKYADGIALHMIGNSVALAISEPGKNAFDAEIEVGKLDFDKEMAKVQGEIDDIKMLITMILNL